MKQNSNCGYKKLSDMKKSSNKVFCSLQATKEIYMNCDGVIHQCSKLPASYL